MHRRYRIPTAAALLAMTVLASPSAGAPATASSAKAGTPAMAHKPAAPRTAAPVRKPAPERAATEARDEQPLYYLSWHAPYGMRRASATCYPSCADSTRIDTLWVSFEPSREESSYVGIGGVITLTAGPADSLRSFWEMGKGGANHGGMYAELGPSDDMPGEHAFESSGVGYVEFERAPVGAYFRFFYVVGQGHGIPLQPGHRYTAGRILVRAIHPGIDGCTQPVCLSWGRADFAFGSDRSFTLHSGGSHVVSRGIGPDPCRARVPAWQPRPAAPAPPQPGADAAPGSGGH